MKTLTCQRVAHPNSMGTEILCPEPSDLCVTFYLVGHPSSYKNEVLVTQSCPTLCDPMDCSLPGSTVCGILQARILERVAIPSPGDLLDPGSPALQADSLLSEPPGITFSLLYNVLVNISKPFSEFYELL